MDAIFSIFENIPTSYYSIGGIFFLYLLYQRYDQNTRYNQKSSPLEPPASPVSASSQKSTTSTRKVSASNSTKTSIQLTEQMVDFLKSYGAVESSWASWGLKKLFPEELLEDLREKALKGDLKPGMKIEIQDGKWRVV